MSTKRDVLNGTVVDGTTDALAVQYNGIGGGKCGRSRIQDDTPFSTALQLITQVTVETQTADRLLDIEYSLTIRTDDVGGAQIRLLEDDGSTITFVNRHNHYCPVASQDFHIEGTFEASPAAIGTYTYLIYLGQAGDDIQLRVVADDPTVPGNSHGFSYLWVYDVAKLGDFA